MKLQVVAAVLIKDNKFLNVSKIGHTMNYIYGSWLPKSGQKLREAPDPEIYDKRFRPDSEDSELDIYIPVQ